ncbi:MAG: hypothetical protein KDB94_10770 [Acidobacteria bacterium]|nr:hypothetical protein [Acidobacteriota bacterium]MCB9378339.1 hypothetical protein [Holophagales bacterium]
MAKTALWILAVVVTLASAAWQRLSGPTHPARGEVAVGGESIRYKIPRTGVTGREIEVAIAAPEGVAGTVVWRRFPTSDPWEEIAMSRAGDRLTARLPTQPAAGKIEYRVRLESNGSEATLPPEPAVARYRGEVPAYVLIPHIFAMFFGMLFSNAAGLFAVTGAGGGGGAARQGRWALGLMAVGGLLLGPLVQKFAFDAWWTGFPFGTDLTDNKTAIALLAWIVALWAARGGRRARAAIVAAALVTLVVFAIPHSLFGSQLRWEETPAATSGS